MGTNGIVQLTLVSTKKRRVPPFFNELVVFAPTVAAGRLLKRKGDRNGKWPGGRRRRREGEQDEGEGRERSRQVTKEE